MVAEYKIQTMYLMFRNTATTPSPVVNKRLVTRTVCSNGSVMLSMVAVADITTTSTSDSSRSSYCCCCSGGGGGDSCSSSRMSTAAVPIVILNSGFSCNKIAVLISVVATALIVIAAGAMQTYP